MVKIGEGLDRHGGPDALTLAAFALVLTGLLVKAAAVPFHFWLPDAHAVAPTPVCMLLSGVMVELGAYGVWRICRTVFSGPAGIPASDLERALVVLGVLTAVASAVMCWYQRHVKRLRTPRSPTWGSSSSGSAASVPRPTTGSHCTSWATQG
jgi:multicomponent Na+:H+ antiporter subunit D